MVDSHQREQARKILYWLEQHHCTLAVAESVTGGRLSAVFTSIAGASYVYRGGVCAYQDEAKQQLLGISEETLSRDGAVSAAVASAMAQGVQRLLSVDVTVSTTGFAGPGGPDEDLGLLWCAVRVGQQEVQRSIRYAGTREERQEAFTREALQWLWEALIDAN